MTIRKWRFAQRKSQNTADWSGTSLDLKGRQ